MTQNALIDDPGVMAYLTSSASVASITEYVAAATWLPGPDVDGLGAGRPLSKLRYSIGVAGSAVWCLDRCTLLKKEGRYRLDLFPFFCKGFFSGCFVANGGEIDILHP